ncbi:MAG: YggS family pyridoxal phosphate-dependent enzyme [Acidobacteriota bacterium]|nr:YggS family pyridoxal phosphate-dependent enzyme [Acidobacteriota bacterium]
MNQPTIAGNLARVQEQVSAACRKAGRSADEVALMAVSKVHPVEAILEACAAGHRLFGENRVQELMAKAPSLLALRSGPHPARFHLIGPLQSNKTTKAAELFDAIDTVDSLKIAQRLDSAAAALHRTLPVLVEVKLSHEETKHGLAPDELPALLDALANLPHLQVRGLMTVPPWSEAPETARPYFRQLRQLRDQQQRRFPSLTELSMGMSNDFAVAIEEGSTCVRIGTAIFGKRILSQQPAAE